MANERYRELSLLKEAHEAILNHFATVIELMERDVKSLLERKKFDSMKDADKEEIKAILQDAQPNDLKSYYAAIGLFEMRIRKIELEMNSL